MNVPGLIYVLVGVLAALAAMAFVVPPLLRRRGAEAVSERQAELSAHRARFVELEGDREAGNLSDRAYREAREELERQLLAGVDGAAGDRGRAGGRGMALVAGVIVPVFALGVYLLAGQPGAVLMPAGSASQVAGDVPSGEKGRAFIKNNLAQLQRRVAESPGDVKAARMLARAYLVLDRPDDAAAVLADVIEREGARAGLLVDRARALALAGNGRFSGEPRELLERAVSMAPGNGDALWFGGIAAAQSGDTARARALWRRLLAELPKGGDAAQRLAQAIDQLGRGAADTKTAAGGSRIALQVRLAPELAPNLPADTAVFVFARAPDGPPLPLAVQRLTLGQLPATVILDESMAMAGRSLADAQAVELVARVSPSGQATPSAGDLEGSVGPVRVDGDTTAELVIDRHR